MHDCCDKKKFHSLATLWKRHRVNFLSRADVVFIVTSHTDAAI